MDTHHLRTILWLRWRLMRNQWKRHGSVNAVVSIIVAICVLVAGIGGSLVGIWAGFFKLSNESPLALLAALDVLTLAFLFMWMIGILSDLQRSESIDISRLLHLPISVKQIFGVNYLVSHFTFSIVLLVPGMVGLCLGLIFGKSWAMGLLLLVLAGLIFAVTAWTYCLRGWLVSLMSNPRKRRAVIAIATFSFIVIAQLPNFYTQTMGNHRRKPRIAQTEPNQAQTDNKAQVPAHKRMPKSIWIAHQAVPFLWAGHSAMTLAQGHVLPALWRAAVLFGLGGLGLSRAYRLTIRFYHGQSNAGSTKVKRNKPKTKNSTSSRSRYLEHSIPGLPQEVAVLALASFRSMARAPEIKMQLATQSLMLLFFGIMALVRHSSAIPDTFKLFLPTGAVVFTFFSLSQLMFNQFGFDRNGFRSYLLWPAPRHHILLGKNLSFLPFALIIGIIILAIVTLSKKLSLLFVGCGLIQLWAAFLLISTIANLTSILVPYRIGQGSLKPTKTKPITTFFMILASLSFPLLMVPVMAVPTASYFLNRAGWITPQLSLPLLSAILFGLCLWCYTGTLRPLGRLLQRREQRILEIVTHEVE